jgi:hypothetical protein
MSDSREATSPPGPRRLSWGKSSSQRTSSSRPTTSSLQGGQQQYAELKQADSCTATSSSAEAQCRDQQPYQVQQLQDSGSPPGDQQVGYCAAWAVLALPSSFVLGASITKQLLNCPIANGAVLQGSVARGAVCCAGRVRPAFGPLPAHTAGECQTCCTSAAAKGSGTGSPSLSAVLRNKYAHPNSFITAQ